MTSRAKDFLLPALVAFLTPPSASAEAADALPEMGLCKTKPAIMAALSRVSTQARAVPLRQRLTLQLSLEKSVILPGRSPDLEKERAKATGATYAGVVRLEADRPGTYRVSVDQDVWLDIATAAGDLLEPAPDEETFTCEGAQKVLLYTLPQAGTYWLQIALSPRRETLLTVIPAG
jgi:hypothetical protein